MNQNGRTSREMEPACQNGPAARKRYRETARHTRYHEKQFGCLRIPGGVTPVRGFQAQTADHVQLPEEWEKVRGVILPVLLGADACGGRLADVPARKVLDLRLVCGVTIYRQGGMRTSVVPGYPMLSRWKITEEDVFRAAAKNAAREKPRLRPLLPGLYGGSETDDGDSGRDEGGAAGVREPLGPDGPRDGDCGRGAAGEAAPLTICTNREHFLGASEILRPGVLEQFCRRRGIQGCFILPSSIHEVLLFVPEERRNLSDLERMIRHINKSTVRVTEQLSDRLYRYDLSDGSLSLALSGESIPLAGIPET